MTRVQVGPQTAWPALQEAQRAILIDVLVHGSRTRAELARRTGLSRTSLTRLTRSLIDLGLIAEGETRAVAGRGRPGELLEVIPDAAHFIGIKLTGDAAYVAVIDLGASALATEEHPIASRDVESVVELLAEIVARLRSRFSRVSAIGVCLAGHVESIDGSLLIVDSEFLGWDAVPLADLVTEATGLPTSIANDVQSLTAAHHWFGAGVGHRSMALVVFGAGVACGIVFDDELVRGEHGQPGRISHITVASDGPLCDSGHRGCVLSYATSGAIVTNAGGGSATLDEVVAGANADDERALGSLELAATAIGVVVAYLANLLDPGVIIVTGEGLPAISLARGAFDAAVSSNREPIGAPTNVDVQDFHFVDYARAAAIGAVQLIV